MKFVLTLVIIVALILLPIFNDKNKYVALYEDGMTKDDIIAIFPLISLSGAMSNCNSVADHFRSEDKLGETISPVTGVRPVYRCSEIKKFDLVWW